MSICGDIEFRVGSSQSARKPAQAWVSFEEAATVFGDDDALIEDDLEHSDDEDRFIITGMSWKERVLLTAYTIRRAETVRIISSRRAEPHERRTYEEKITRRNR
jgi:uncharacterized DUF497 family protein